MYLLAPLASEVAGTQIHKQEQMLGWLAANWAHQGQAGTVKGYWPRRSLLVALETGSLCHSWWKKHVRRESVTSRGARQRHHSTPELDATSTDGTATCAIERMYRTLI